MFLPFKDTVKVPFSVHLCDKNFHVTKELAFVVPLIGTTKGNNILKAVMTMLNHLKLNLKVMSGVTTDVAPSMCGS